MSVEVRSTARIRNERAVAHELLEWLSEQYESFDTLDLESVHVATEGSFEALYSTDEDRDLKILNFGSFVDEEASELVQKLSDEYPQVPTTLVQRVKIEATGDMEVEWIEKTEYEGDDS